MPPIRKGDGTPVEPKGVSQIRTGDGRILFDGPAISDSVLLPESDDLTHFGGDTTDFDINTNSPKFNTGFTDLSLKFTGSSNVSIGSLSGLDNYPEVGQPHRIAAFNGTGDSRWDLLFSNDSETELGTGYGIFARPRDDDITIRRWDDGSVDNLQVLNEVGWTIGEWHEIEILHEANGDLTVTVFDKDGTQIDQGSANDSTHITDGTYDNVGVGLRQSENNTDDAWDFWRFID